MRLSEAEIACGSTIQSRGNRISWALPTLGERQGKIVVEPAMGLRSGLENAYLQVAVIRRGGYIPLAVGLQPERGKLTMACHARELQGIVQRIAFEGSRVVNSHWPPIPCLCRQREAKDACQQQYVLLSLQSYTNCLLPLPFRFLPSRYRQRCRW